MTDVDSQLLDGLVQRVLASFPTGRYGWRTVRGVSQDLGLGEETVATVIDAHPDLFRRSSVSPAGIPLYKPREHRPAGTTG